jgi:hypothetical protein
MELELEWAWTSARLLAQAQEGASLALEQAQTESFDKRQTLDWAAFVCPKGFDAVALALAPVFSNPHAYWL